MIKVADVIDDKQFKIHQLKGIEKANQSNGSVLLDWKVGSGKTFGSIGIYEDLKKKNKANTALVVTPSQLKDNYLTNGIKKFTNSDGVIIGNSTERNKPNFVSSDNIPEGKNYYIISNEMFRENPSYFINKTHADTAIIDEIQKYRDPNSKNYKQFMEARPLLKNVIGMTGTPFSNHPQDIVPILDVITNKKHSLGNQSQFKKRYIKKEKVRSGPLSFIGIGPQSDKISITRKDELKKELAKYVHSYHDPDADMPDKVIEDIDVPMNKEQEDVYNWIMHNHINPITYAKVKYNLPVNQSEAKNIFESLLKARQASNSLHLFKDKMTLEESAERTPKIKKVITDISDHLNENPKNKAIVYSNFLHGGVDVTSAGLKKMNIPHSTFTGTKNMSLKERNKSVEDYLSGKSRVIILNQAGAEGLNLPGTTGHFALDGHFNPAMMEQSEARGIRAGSPVDKVVVKRYKTVMPETRLDKFVGPNFKPLKMIKGYSTDEWVYSTAKRKKDLNDQIQEVLR